MCKSALLLFVAGVLMLSGCASVDRRAEVVDVMRVAQVESAAKNVGVQVYWINYPTKTVTN
jgi:uncharacterized lipoprotein YajG